jgi:UDP-N-acetylmuramoyl-L-alanyl-D-glutamate--2,6-diaminopimelate ligase
MKLLKDILYKVSLLEVAGNTSVSIDNICFDSRQVKQGDVFVATKGVAANGHQYIDKAISLGAIAIVCEEMPISIVEAVTYVKVKDSSYALGIMAANFYEEPSTRMKIVGVTGTNGKTSVATLLFKMFRHLGYHVGLVSTVENKIDDTTIPSTHTTPDALKLNQLFAMMIEQGCTHCFMEVSSHAIHQERIAGVKFVGGIFTNLTHDHLDYHKTFKDYLNAKKKFFDDMSSDAFVITNMDDKNGMVMLQNTKAKKYTYALKSPADFKAKILENTFLGLSLNIDGQELHTALIGEFNAYNMLAVYGAAISLGIEKIEVLKVLSILKSAEGRFDYIVSSEEKVIGIIDYAHTPDALLKVLETIKGIRTGNEQLIAVVGCGGDRDVSKRPLMAAVSCDFSDKVILTSDNPRSEDPAQIITEMSATLNPAQKKKVLSIVDRKEAIRTACALANHGDIILVAGKGHEKYQEIKGVKYPFDDKSILTETFKELDK